MVPYTSPGCLEALKEDLLSRSAPGSGKVNNAERPMAGLPRQSSEACLGILRIGILDPNSGESNFNRKWENEMEAREYIGDT